VGVGRASSTAVGILTEGMEVDAGTVYVGGGDMLGAAGCGPEASVGVGTSNVECIMEPDWCVWLQSWVG
jgi:hypothetical protein